MITLSRYTIFPGNSRDLDSVNFKSVLNTTIKTFLDEAVNANLEHEEYQLQKQQMEDLSGLTFETNFLR